MTSYLQFSKLRIHFQKLNYNNLFHSNGSLSSPYLKIIITGFINFWDSLWHVWFHIFMPEKFMLWLVHYSCTEIFKIGLLCLLSFCCFCFAQNVADHLLLFSNHYQNYFIEVFLKCSLTSSSECCRAGSDVFLIHLQGDDSILLKFSSSTGMFIWSNVREYSIWHVCHLCFQKYLQKSQIYW